MGRALVVLSIIGVRGELVLALASALFVLAALATAGLVDSIYSLIEDTVTPSAGPSKYYAVITSYSVAPFTSVVREDIIKDRLSRVSGVNGVVYEVLTPVIVDGSTYLLRGVDYNDLTIVAGNYTVVGESFDKRCLTCVWVGEHLAAEAGIEPNDTILIHSPLASSDFVMRVCGVLHTDSLLKYELVTNLRAAAVVRGLGPGAYSFAVIFVDSRESLASVAEAFNLSLSGRGLIERAFLALRVAGSKFTPYLLESLSESLISRIGLSREILVATLIGTVGVLGLGFYVLGQAVAANVSRKVRLLHELGVSRMYLMSCVSFLGTAVIVLGGVAGLAVAYAVFPFIGVEIMGYVRHPSIDPAFFLASLAVASSLAIAGSWSYGVVED